MNTQKISYNFPESFKFDTYFHYCQDLKEIFKNFYDYHLNRDASFYNVAINMLVMQQPEKYEKIKHLMNTDEDLFFEKLTALYCENAIYNNIKSFLFEETRNINMNDEQEKKEIIFAFLRKYLISNPDLNYTNPNNIYCISFLDLAIEFKFKKVDFMKCLKEFNECTPNNYYFKKDDNAKKYHGYNYTENYNDNVFLIRLKGHINSCYKKFENTSQLFNNCITYMTEKDQEKYTNLFYNTVGGTSWDDKTKEKFIKKYLTFYITNKMLKDIKRYEFNETPEHNLKKFIELVFVKDPVKGLKNHNVFFRSIIRKNYKKFGYTKKTTLNNDLDIIIEESYNRYF